jgi:HEAT repeat protein
VAPVASAAPVARAGKAGKAARASVFRAPPLPRTLEAALRDVVSTKPAVRADALRDLARHAGPDASEEAAARGAEILRAFETALRDAAPEVRAAAALGLADARAKEALPALLVAVEDESGHVRQMAITALGELGDSRATERLRRALSDPRPEVRFQAAIAFPRVCVARGDAIEALVRATEDSDPMVCQVALRMAEEMGALGDDGSDPEAQVVDPRVLARARALVEHASPLVRTAAAIILARDGDELGRDTLVAVASGELSTSDGEDEAAAIELCGELGERRAVRGLEKRAFGGLLGLRSDRFAWHARVALARMGHERARREILRDLGSWDRGRRILAVAAAGRARMSEAREALLRLRDTNQVDAQPVDDALALIDGGAGGRATRAAGEAS